MKTRTVQLGEILEIEKGKKAERLLDRPSPTACRYLQIEDLRPAAKPKFVEPFACPLATPADVIIAWDGANAGTVSCNLVGYIGSTIAILRPDYDAVFPPYLSRFLEGKFDYLQANTTGATIPHISKDILESLQLPLPSLPEQRRIAALLEQADGLRRTRCYALDLSDTFLPAAFLEMFGDPKENTKGWPQSYLADLCLKFSDGPFGSNLKSEHYTRSGVRVVRLQNIGVGDFVDDDQAFIAQTHFECLKKHECLPDDVLIGTLGDPNLRACILPSTVSKALNKADCIQARPDPAKADRHWLCWLLNMPSTLYLVPGMVHGQTRARVSMGELSELSVPVPPLPLQQRFADLVRGHERLRAAQRESLRQAEHLFQSLLHRAFEEGM